MSSTWLIFAAAESKRRESDLKKLEQRKKNMKDHEVEKEDNEIRHVQTRFTARFIFNFVMTFSRERLHTAEFMLTNFLATSCNGLFDILF